MYYSAETGKKPGIVLIKNPDSRERYVKRVLSAITHHGVEITVYTVDLK
ncbi:hypothetical protein [Enterovibrio calviensis]|nr:hypothetical protein [Enterovibrio calviensis]